METFFGSIRTCWLLFGGKVNSMIDMSVHQPLCLFKFIHVIVDGKIVASTLINNLFIAAPSERAG